MIFIKMFLLLSVAHGQTVTQQCKVYPICYSLEVSSLHGSIIPKEHILKGDQPMTNLVKSSYKGDRCLNKFKNIIDESITKVNGPLQKKLAKLRETKSQSKLWLVFQIFKKDNGACSLSVTLREATHNVSSTGLIVEYHPAHNPPDILEPIYKDDFNDEGAAKGDVSSYIPMNVIYNLYPKTDLAIDGIDTPVRTIYFSQIHKAAN
jgi:hypothetical protein